MTMRSLVMSSLMKVLRGLFGRLTARGWSFLAAGGAAVLGGLAIPEPDLVRAGALLVVLPLGPLGPVDRADWLLGPR
jgi:hypothetical protein